MKTLCLAICVCFLLSPFSAGSEALFEDEPLIKASYVVEIDDCVLVAILSRQIFYKSDSVKLKQRIVEKVSKLYNDKEILVSFDVDVYYDLQYALESQNEDSFQKALNKAKTRA